MKNILIMLMFISGTSFADWDEVDWDFVQDMCYEEARNAACQDVWDYCRRSTPDTKVQKWDGHEWYWALVKRGKRRGTLAECNKKVMGCKETLYVHCVTDVVDRTRGTVVWIWEEEFFNRYPEELTK